MSQKRDKIGEGFPYFPALHKCAVIDARHGSRLELIKDVKASALFQNIQLAKSLRDGSGILQWQEIDACFIGSSIAPVRTLEFLAEIRDHIRSTDCAFIVVLNAIHEAAVVGLLDAGVHGIIYRPCTRSVFAEGVVKAVIKANGNGTWAGIALKHGFDELISGTVLLAQRKEELDGGHVNIIEENSSELNEAMQIVARAASELQIIIDGIESGEFRLGADGHPTRRSTEVIDEVVDKIFKESDISEDAREFKAYFRNSIDSWFVDLINLSQREATENLRAALAKYLKY